MNPVVSAQLRQFRANNPMSELNDDDYFELYTIYSILNGGLSKNIDPFDIYLEGCEFGVDGCAIAINNELVSNLDEALDALEDVDDAHISFTFIQAKSSEKYDYGEMSKFFDAISMFFDEGLTGESHQLDDLIIAKDSIYNKALIKNPDINCYFASTGSYNSEPRLERLISATKKD